MSHLPRTLVRHGSSPRVLAANLAAKLLAVAGPLHGSVRRLEGIQGGLQVRAFGPRRVHDFSLELCLLLRVNMKMFCE